MDFVEGLGEASDVMEVPVDGIGRVEVYRGRLRVTLTRAVERNGIIRERPALTLVWSTIAWLDARTPYDQVRKLVLANTNGVALARKLSH